MPIVERHAYGTPAWADLMTPDLERARAFYGPLFGWEFAIGGAESGFYTTCKRGARAVAGMGKQPEGAPYPTSWNVYFAVESADATTARVLEHGGQVPMGPMDVFGEGRLAFCADSTGAVFGLWQPMRHRGAELVDEPGAMAWAEVETRDAQQACAFYGAVFGLQTRRMEGGGMIYYTLHRDERAVGGVRQMDEKQPPNAPPHWMIYFAIDAADAAVARVRELGGNVCVPAFDTPYGRVAVVGDPLGATFSIIELAESRPR